MDIASIAMQNMEGAAAGGMFAYSVKVAKKAMDVEAQSAAQILDMLPEQQFRVRGPQPGDVPAIPKGDFFDTYA
jgi:hypothetical protein